MSSTVFTVGTALSRAQDGGNQVDVLVDGHWLTGRVASLDGYGALLDQGSVSQAVVRIERIAVVRVMSEGVTVPEAHALPSERMSA